MTIVAATAIVVMSSAASAATSPMVRGFCVAKPADAKPADAKSSPPPAMRSRANALALLDSLTQLRSPLGRKVLDSNFAITVAINNLAPAELRRQALRDAQVTATNAFTLADGLGLTMGEAYRRKATFTSADDGQTIQSQDIGPAVAALFKAARTAAGDSGEAKCAFANGVEPFQGGTYQPPAGGIVDVLGQAYNLPAGAEGGSRFGNPRPFLTAPLNAPKGPHIETFEGADFFGVPMNSHVVLSGPTEADLAAGRYAESLADSPSYPSGHTTFAYGESLLLALMVPERLRALAYRASEYGNSRIVLGAHYAVDVIAGRTLATYDLAQALAGKAGYGDGQGGTFQAKLAEAGKELRTYLQANGCPSIAACGHEPIERAGQAGVLMAGRAQSTSPREAYAYRLNYGLATMGSEKDPPEPMPVAAGFLLQSRFPYLLPEQRSDVLRSTEGPSGHFLDINPVDGTPLSKRPTGPASQVGAYSRIDLFAAAGGYGSFSDRVVADQEAKAITDPNLQPFADYAKADTWSNDIGGLGGLTKRGSGTLTLSGADTFAGPTLVEGGTLEIAGSVVSTTTVESGGTLAGAGSLGDVFVLDGGALALGSADLKTDGGALAVGGTLALSRGSTVVVRGGSKEPLVRVATRVILDTPKLVVKGKRNAGDRLTLLTSPGGVLGTFGPVTLEDASLDAKLQYATDSVTLTVVPKGQAPN